MYLPEMLVILSINRWIFPQVRTGLDTFLFNLVILGALKSCTGQIWRRRSSDLYVIEITSALPRGENQTAEKRLKTAKVNKILNLDNKNRRLSSYVEPNAFISLNRLLVPRKSQQSFFTGFFPLFIVEHQCKHYLNWELIQQVRIQNLSCVNNELYFALSIWRVIPNTSAVWF